jgi:tetratricopeptide (TPR) repeat protein
MPVQKHFLFFLAAAFLANGETRVPDVQRALDLTNLAAKYRAQGRPADAEPMLVTAISILDKCDHPDFPRVLMHAALVAHDLGNDSQAELRSRRALEVLQGRGQQDSTEAATAHNVLGIVLDSLGLEHEAQAEFERALALRERLLGNAHPSVGETLNKLGLAYRQTGRISEAESAYRRSLDILLANGPSIELGTAHNNLGSLFIVQGNLHDAEYEIKEAMAVWERMLGQEHPNIAAAMRNLSSLERARHRLGEAEVWLNRALAMDRKLFPEGDVRIGRDLNVAGTLAADRKRYADAERFFRESLAILDRMLPESHPDRGRVLANLADVLRLERRAAESDASYRDGLAILGKAWGVEDPRLLAWLESYAGLLRSEQNFADAAKVDMQAMKIRVKATLKINLHELE